MYSILQTWNRHEPELRPITAGRAACRRLLRPTQVGPGRGPDQPELSQLRLCFIYTRLELSRSGKE